MIIFKTTHHLSRLKSFSPCSFQEPCTSYTRLGVLSSVLSSQSRCFNSSDSLDSITMELVKSVAGRECTSPGSIAIRAEKKSHSYQQLILSARKISSWLSNACLTTANGVGEHKQLGGARVGIVAKPSAEFIAGVLGTWYSGGVAVPLALSYPEAELMHVMNDSDIAMILSTEDHQELMKAVAAKTSAQLSILTPVPSIDIQSTKLDQSRNGEIDGLIFNELNGDDPALIIYTSGTTGKPKGVVHTHRGILAQVQMLTDAWGYTSTDQFLHCLPLHHIQNLV